VFCTGGAYVIYIWMILNPLDETFYYITLYYWIFLGRADCFADSHIFLPLCVLAAQEVLPFSVFVLKES
jgi:hypothetical protein